MKEYILKPIMTPATLNLTANFDKPAVTASAVTAVRPRNLPPRQPLPTAVRVWVHAASGTGGRRGAKFFDHAD